ncbi:MAG: hypothetical protein D6797_09350 [Bdellovibrio sp.]|nr:MAG: hypothetical protein D6797_09350 [Bdellovibrio sp.]
MLEIRKSRNGQTVALWDGRHLCSSIDPLAEAQKWCQGYQKKIERGGALVVLGLGCGYHVEELLKENHLIIVIEKQEKLIDLFSQRCTSASLYLLSGKVEELFKEEVLISVLRGHYQVLDHDPSQITDLLFYKKVRRLLLGRRVEEAKAILKRRKDVRPIQIQEDLSSDHLVSFKDFIIPGRESLLKDVKYTIHALRELIV